ncbi:2TM domain-containing protein [Winogradskyella pacifica]|uniref:2TM domain-containing protein n=1 Tax=Winogradskyella pacifica TaxID=664642 RepID=UPI0015CE4E43|nr:2TM domain-containing protein [Winogradskyella pacifica]
MEKQDSELKYLRAKTRVEKLKAFYTHVTVYFVINTVVTAVKVMNNIHNGETYSEAFFDFSTVASWLVWGVGLALHAFSVFGLPLILGEDWEARKIEEYMNDELQQDKSSK